ncbi:MAG: helix-turn-helix transcriptional regulator, partial [Candidatus Ornithospirochaeta sp.]
IFPFLEYPETKSKLQFEGIVTGRTTYKRKINKSELNRKEGDVLDAMSYGMSQKEIASLLGTSIRTIRRIQNKLLIKTGLDNLKQLGIYSVAENWMSLDE